MAYRGRPRDDSLKFFPFSTKLTRDRKLTRLRRKHGILSTYVYICIIETIYGGEHGYYMVADDDAIRDLMEYELEMDDLTKVREIIDDLVKANLFSEDLYREHGILTSMRIQEECNYATRLTKKRDADIEPDYCLISLPHGLGENELTPEESQLTPEENELTPEFLPNSSGIPPRRLDKTRLDKTRLDERKAEESTGPAGPGPVAAATAPHRDHTPEAVVLLRSMMAETTPANIKGACAWIERLGIDTVQRAAENARDRGKGWGYVIGTLKNLEAQQGKATQAGRPSSAAIPSGAPPPITAPPVDDGMAFMGVDMGGADLSPDAIPFGYYDE